MPRETTLIGDAVVNQAPINMWRGDVQEFFDFGQAMEVTSLWTNKDGRYEACFKSRCRHDGLVRRAELGNGKLVEEFEGRSDGLTYRSGRFAARIRGSTEPTGVW